LANHKTVGLQYGITAMVFLLVGFLLMILMRVQLAWPGQALPSWIGSWLGEANAPGGIMLPEFYNQLVAMHGSVMVFLAVVPLAAGARPIEVHVAGEQFAWNIHYPGPDGVFGRIDNSLVSATNPVGIDRTDPAAADDIGVLNVLMLPLNRTAVVLVSSRDVVHSFTLNEMRVKQDAVPGMTARVWFTPTMKGDWEIACSQLCGLGHYRMRGEYHVVDQDAWDRWQAAELARLRQ